MALTRDEVVAGAIRLLDEVGLEGLTLRRLAADLGVSAPTLYWHVRDKRALLDLMAVAMQGEHPPVRPAPGQSWWEWLGESAWSQYRALLAHRDGARVAAGNRPTPEALPVIDHVVGSLVEVGFRPAEAMEALFTIGHFVIGSALEYQAEAARAAAGEGDAAAEVRLRSFDGLPNLAQAIRARGGPDPDATFRYGLEVFLAGLRARQAALTAGPSAT